MTSHKGIEIRVLIEGRPILFTNSLMLHYIAQLEQCKGAEWVNIIPLVEMNGSGNEILLIQMRPGVFGELSDDET